jgi:hypothetical protein
MTPECTLGTVLYTPVSSFGVTTGGSYVVQVSGEPDSEKVLIGPTYLRAFEAVAPWLACLAGGLALTLVGWLGRDGPPDDIGGREAGIWAAPISGRSAETSVH